jgi:hypothetical protein
MIATAAYWLWSGNGSGALVVLAIIVAAWIGSRRAGK